MAYTRKHLAPTGYNRWQHRRMVGYKSLASQDLAQEIQVWYSSDCDNTNCHSHLHIQRKYTSLYLPMKYDIGLYFIQLIEDVTYSSCPANTSSGSME